MATTKALELGQFGTDLTVDDSTGAVTIANDVTVNAATSTGIDDNADQTVITIDNNEKVTIAGNLEVSEIGNNNTGLITIDVDATAHAMLRFQEASSDLWRIVKEPTNELVIDQGAGNIDFTFSTSGDFTVHDGDVIIETGGIKGPSVLYIDPATYDTDSDAGSAAGTVRIRGDLIVDGDTTTINSTTLTVADLKIVAAEGATADTDGSSAAADGAGLYIGSDTSPIASLKYDDTSDGWQIDKALGIGTGPDMLYSDGVHIYGGNPSIKIEGDATNSWEFIHLKNPTYERLIGMRTTGAIVINSGTDLDANNYFVVENTGNVGINAGGGGTPASSKLTVNVTTNSDGIELQSSGVKIATLARTAVDSQVVASLDGVATRPIHIGGIVNEDVILANAGGNVGIKEDNPEQSLHVAGKAIVRDGGYPYLELGISTTNYFRAVHDNPNDSLTFQRYGLTGNILTLHGGSGVGVTIGDNTNNKNLNVHGEVTANQYNNDEVRHSIRPTLNLDFANSKELDPRITFYRDSIATYYDSKGVLRYANVNKPRFDHDPVTGESKGLLIEEARTNSIPSQYVNTSFTQQEMIVEMNAGIAPDGTHSAQKIIPTSNNGTHQIAFLSLLSSTTCAMSVYAKADGMSTFTLLDGSVASNGTAFNLSNGTVTNVNSAQGYIFDVGNGWFRCVTIVETTGFRLYAPTTSSNTSGDGYSGILIWGMQVEQGGFATSYIPSDTRFTSRSSTATYYDETDILRTAPANSPRYGYSSPYATEHWAIVSTLKTKIGSSEPERRATETGLILENAATNLENYSYNMDTTNHGSFVSSGGSFAVTDEVAAPDGSYTASKFVFGAGNDRMDDQHGAHNQGTYTFSMWVKGVAGEVVGMSLLNDLGGNVEPYILLTGEWQRISITKTFDSQGTNIRTHGVIIRGAPGVGIYATGDDGGNGTLGTWANYVYVWGMQVESGFTSTSYIPTFGGTATRSADVASSSAYTREVDLAFLDLSKIENYDYESVTVLHEIESFTYDDNARLISIDDNTLDNRVSPQLQSDTQIRVVLNSDAVTYVNTTATMNASGTNDWSIKNKYAFSLDNNEFALHFNGVQRIQDTSVVPVYKATQLRIGGLNSGFTSTGCHRKIALYNQVLSVTEMNALTENN